MKTIKELKTAIDNDPARSAWDKAVKLYAYELIEEKEDDTEFYGSPADRKDLLNGASSWHEYSWGGSALIYNYEIAERVCSPSEYKRRKEGELPPNSSEEWLDVQARALHQAERMILRLAK